MVASVGPYSFRFANWRCLGPAAHAIERQGFAEDGGSLRAEENAPGRSSRSRVITMATDGTENHTVRRCSTMNFAGAMTARGGITHSAAPACQDANKSCTLRSKVRSNVCETRSSGWRSNLLAMWSRSSGNITLGHRHALSTPVLPEVKSRYAMLSGEA